MIIAGDFMLSFKAATHIGGRTKNEDAVLGLHEADRYCFVLADGLGGHGQGEVASARLIEVFASEFEKDHPGNQEFLQTAFERSQTEIMALQKDRSSQHGMKTTGVSLSVRGDKCQWGHIGDSRLYLFKNNKFKLRTLDHSVPQMLLLAGEIKEKDLAGHPDRNRLLRAIGVEWDEPRYELSEELNLKDCQAFLLCSDGFWELISPKKMAAFLKRSTSVADWLEKMIEEVQKNGQGKDMDNYTALAVIVENEG